MLFDARCLKKRPHFPVQLVPETFCCFSTANNKYRKGPSAWVCLKRHSKKLRAENMLLRRTVNQSPTGHTNIGHSHREKNIDPALCTHTKRLPTTVTRVSISGPRSQSTHFASSCVMMEETPPPT